MNKNSEILYIVIPCYNEEEVLPETSRRLTDKLQRMVSDGLISDKSRMVFVDDGSKDATWPMIVEYHKTNPYVLGVKSSRNRGHQNALIEGLFTVKDCCDMVVSMDADLQDDIEVLDEFVRQYYDGCDIVYGTRSSRKKDTFFKRVTAQSYYKLLSGMGVDIVYNHADYRLMSRRAIEALMEYKEVNLFLRGIVPMIGYKTGVVTYERSERFAGKSKYPLGKMLAFAMDGITSLSIKPIRFITTMGTLVFLIGVVFLIHIIVGYFHGGTAEGWATTVVSIWALGGLQLLAIGVIGEYIGKIYLEAKGRPRFFVEEFLSDEQRDSNEN